MPGGPAVDGMVAQDFSFGAIEFLAADEPAQGFAWRRVQVGTNGHSAVFSHQSLGGCEGAAYVVPVLRRSTARHGRNHETSSLRTLQRPLLLRKLLGLAGDRM